MNWFSGTLVYMLNGVRTEDHNVSFKVAQSILNSFKANGLVVRDAMYYPHPTQMEAE